MAGFWHKNNKNNKNNKNYKNYKNDNKIQYMSQRFIVTGGKHRGCEGLISHSSKKFVWIRSGGVDHQCGRMNVRIVPEEREEEEVIATTDDTQILALADLLCEKLSLKSKKRQAHILRRINNRLGVVEWKSHLSSNVDNNIIK